MSARLVLAIAATGLAMLACSATSHATFPGENGKILVSRTVGSGSSSNKDIYAVDHVTGAATRLTIDPASDVTPAASPDGTKVAFARSGSLYVMNADGTGETPLTATPPMAGDPSWSPDGTQIVFDRQDFNAGDFGTKLYVIDADGGNLHRITSSPDLRWDFAPDWSPDGSTILFNSNSFELWKVNPDGTGMVRVLGYGLFPSWSPDGSKIVYSAHNGEPDSDLFVSDADGTGATNVTPEHTGDTSEGVFSPDGHRIAFGTIGGCCYLWTMDPDGSNDTPLSAQQHSDIDWQPIPVNAYPRPKGATPTTASLVPAYQACAASDRTHGPPLAFPSCAAPAQTSNELTVGTPDSNAKPANGRGNVRYETIVGVPGTPADEADVRLTVEVSDVYQQGSLADYTGELGSRTALRITDKLNTPHPGGPGAGTVVDASLAASVPCSSTTDPSEGASCALTTTFDSLVPGTVTEGRRSVWELGPAQLDDGGADGDADTAEDNTLFMTQGLFIP